MQVDVIADLRPEGRGVVRDQRRAGQADGTRQVLDLLGKPQAQVGLAGPRIGAGWTTSEQHLGGQDRNGHPAGRD